MRQVARLAAMGAALSLLWDAPARADYLVCSLELCHAPMSCSDSTRDCTVFSSNACSEYDSSSGRTFCHPPCTTIFDCAAPGASGCPALGGVPGVCGGGLQLSSGGTGYISGICRYPAWGITYCGSDDDAVPEAVFDACHNGSANYLAGDCDGDGCPNVLDPVPCAPNPPEDCVRSTPGIVSCISRDSRPLVRDGGVTASDAGPTPSDAGSTPSMDGGDEKDAGMRDPSAPSLRFQGGGGCACRVQDGASRADGGVAAVLAAIGGVALARRRRRRRHGASSVSP